MNPALPGNWYYVYLLKSKLVSKFYIGCTNNLQRRLIEHNEGKVFTTKRMLPLELVYFEGYKSKDSAYIREKSLKMSGNSISKIKTRITLQTKGRAG
ncbi:MAG: GIY-YIG nuclease family protein [Candidatus Omnitrophota bacterium]|jgi:putative endonuclease